METVGEIMEKLIQKVLVQRGECPECGQPLYGWRTKNPDGSERCKPTCMQCGYKALRVQEDLQAEQMYNESLKARAINFFKGGSVVPNKALFDCTLQNYQIVDQETRQAVEVTKRFVNSVLLGNPSHLVLTGKQGAGKSHLAMAAAWEVLKRSNYDKKILFIGLQEMLDQIKFSYNNPELRKTIEGSLIADIKTADLVVIDDIGSELGKDASESRAFGINTLNSFLDARQNLATIITTNLLGKELKEAYGTRTTSRMFVNSDGFTMVFSQTADKRLKPVKGATA